MSDDLEVTVEQLREQLQRKGIPLPCEIGAFIALEVCEQIVRAPVRLRTSDVWLGEVGEIMVDPAAARATDEAATRAVLMVLGDLLVSSAPGVPSMLLELVEEGPSSGKWTLAGLRDDLEACLLPLNRGATRRVLARLLREAQREGARVGNRPSGRPDEAALDAELDALLGLDPEEPPTQKKPRPAAPAPSAPDVAPPAPRPPDVVTKAAVAPTIPSLPSAAKDAPPAGAREAGAAARTPFPAAAPAPTPVPVPARAPEPQTQSGRRVRTYDLFEDEPRPKSGGAVIGGVFFFAAVVLGIAYITVGQMGARKLLGLPASDVVAPVASAPSAASVIESGELHVTSTPPHAQVFLRLGPGPALATDLPVGVAQEFVAIANGRVPTRAVVPADAAWESAGQGQARYELAMQTGKELASGADVELGATLLPQAPGAPKGSLGTVRVITTPPGAQVYQLIGFTPDVRVSGMHVDRSYELLVYVPGYAIETRVVQAADFAGVEHVASLDVTLHKRVKH